MTHDETTPLQWRAVYPDGQVAWAAPGLKRFWAWLLFQYDPVDLVGVVSHELSLVSGRGGLHWSPTDVEARRRPDLSPEARSIRLSAEYSAGPSGPSGALGLQVICMASRHPPCGTALLLDFNDVQFGWSVSGAEQFVAETVIHLWNTLPRLVRNFPDRRYPWDVFPMIRGQWNLASTVHIASIGDVVLTPGSLYQSRAHDYEAFPGKQQVQLGVTLDASAAKAWVSWGVALGYYSGPGSARETQAIAAFDQALAVNPRDDDALTKKGRLFVGPGGNARQALNLFDQALAINSRNQEAWYWKAHALVSLGRNEEARAAFERTVAIDPNSEWAGYALENINRL